MPRPKHLRSCGSVKCKNCGEYTPYTTKLPDKCQKCGRDLL